MFFSFRNKLYNLDRIRKFSINDTSGQMTGSKLVMEIFYEGDTRETIEFSSVEEGSSFCLTLHNKLKESVGLIEVNDDFWRSNINRLQMRNK